MDDPKFNKALVPLERHKKRADEMAEYFGITNRYSAGCLSLDQYLGGGYGRKGDGYEIVLLYGASGRGKSIFGLNMMLDPIIKGERVGLMILEDDPADVVNRLRVMTNGAIDDASNVFFAEDQSQGYTLDQALRAVEEWFKICDVIFLDHLEYLFAGALGESERDVFMKQAIWMRRLNSLMKGNGKTIVMVQHTNKTQEQGLDKIKGSGAFAQTCTKIIEVDKIPGGSTVKLWKSRFTITRSEWLELSLSNFRIGDA